MGEGFGGEVSVFPGMSLMAAFRKRLSHRRPPSFACVKLLKKKKWKEGRIVDVSLSWTKVVGRNCTSLYDLHARCYFFFCSLYVFPPSLYEAKKRKYKALLVS